MTRAHHTIKLYSMDLDKLKKAWSDARVPMPGTPDASFVSRQRDARSTIISIYRRLTVVGAFMAVFIWRLMDSSLHLSFRLCLCYSLFMAALVVVNIYFIRRVRAVDVTRMSVLEAFVSSTKLNILRNRIQMAAIPMAAVIIVSLLYELCTNPVLQAEDPDNYAFWGGFGGGVIGLIFGIMVDRRLRRLIRGMRDELERELSQ